MIVLSRAELNEIGRAAVLANTPASLFHQLRGLSAVRKLKECSNEKLAADYKALTSRYRRTEIVLGMAYCVLIAATINGANIDPTSLEWGSVFQDLIRKNAIITNVSSIPSVGSRFLSGPSVVSSNTNESGVIILANR